MPRLLRPLYMPRTLLCGCCTEAGMWVVRCERCDAVWLTCVPHGHG